MVDPTDPPHLFRTSQPRELLACVEFAATQVDTVHDDHGGWRWLIISVTLAVQNACLCALDAGDTFGTKGMSRADAKIIRRWARAGGAGPEPLPVREPRIVAPGELLRRTSDPYFLPPPYQLPLTSRINADFDHLIDLRNTFLHFSDDGWTIDLREVPPLILTACRIIRHLAVTQPAYLRNAEPNHRDRVRKALDQIEAAMDHYDGASIS